MTGSSKLAARSRRELRRTDRHGSAARHAPRSRGGGRADLAAPRNERAGGGEAGQLR